jgi:Nuclease-related domain
MSALIIILVIFFATVLLLAGKRPYLIGKRGENFVSRELSRLDTRSYTTLDDLMLPSNGNTATTQIDHVVVSNFGIFCIETKSYKGWIFGNAQQEYWTQVIHRYRNKFYNPLRQNYAHIKAVEALLGSAFARVPVRGFIAFPRAEKLSISGTDTVDYAADVVVKIAAYTRSVMTDDERNAIVGILLNANIEDKKARKDHVMQTSVLAFTALVKRTPAERPRRASRKRYR